MFEGLWFHGLAASVFTLTLNNLVYRLMGKVWKNIETRRELETNVGDHQRTVIWGILALLCGTFASSVYGRYPQRRLRIGFDTPRLAQGSSLVGSGRSSRQAFRPDSLSARASTLDLNPSIW